MKKIINSPSNVVSEMVSGLVRSYPKIVSRLDNTNIVIRTDIKNDKVGIISGGGSGHEPSHAGFVGKGMLSAAVCGQVFTSPSPDQVLQAIQASNNGKGVFMVIKNYSGDIMNFEMAKDMAEMEGITVDYAIVDDDIAVENSSFTQGNRGVAGTIFVHKILGAAIENGCSIEEIKKLSDQIIPNIKTIGVSLSGATVPEVGKPGFVLSEDEIEYGVGIHGEPGYRKEKLQSSKLLVKELVGKLNKQLQFKENDKYAVLVNGLGATPLMEQFVFVNDVLDELEQYKLNVSFTKVGNYMTAIDMAGISLTLMKITENKWLDYLDKEVKTIAW